MRRTQEIKRQLVGAFTEAMHAAAKDAIEQSFVYEARSRTAAAEVAALIEQLIDAKLDER